MVIPCLVLDEQDTLFITSQCLWLRASFKSVLSPACRCKLKGALMLFDHLIMPHTLNKRRQVRPGNGPLYGVTRTQWVNYYTILRPQWVNCYTILQWVNYYTVLHMVSLGHNELRSGTKQGKSAEIFPHSLVCMLMAWCREFRLFLPLILEQPQPSCQIKFTRKSLRNRDQLSRKVL